MSVGTMIVVALTFAIWAVGFSIGKASIRPRWDWSVQLAKTGVMALAFGILGFAFAGSATPIYGSILGYVLLYTTLYLGALGVAHGVKVYRHNAWVSHQVDLSTARALQEQSQPDQEKRWPQLPPDNQHKPDEHRDDLR